VASNYVGSPTAVQAPGTAPAVNNAPTLSLIQDADGNTAANLYQAWKVLADNEAFILQVLGATRSAKGLLIDGTGGVSLTSEPSHFVCAGTVPAIAAGTGAGTTPSVGLNSDSSDTRGLISITTGTTPAVSSTICTITWSTTYTTKRPIIILTPATATAAALSGKRIDLRSAAGWSRAVYHLHVAVGVYALTASTLYQWNYVVIG
jgi:hypothetical protein